MDEKLPNPEVVASSGLKQQKDLEKIIKAVILIVAILALLLGGYYLLSQKSTLPKIPLTTQTSPTSLPTDSSIVAKVGSENLYKADLDYYLSTYFAGQGYGPKDKALDKMIDDSIILQEGQKSGFISLNNDVFNSPNKNIASRSALIEIASKKIAQKSIKKISGEYISMWFNNANSYPTPAIGIIQAKQQVKDKMDKIYQQLVSGKITMAQAGAQIRADSTQSSIDPSYQGNAYSKFTDLVKTQPLFQDKTVDYDVWSLSNKEFSPVTLVKDFDKNNQPFEAYFVIVRIDGTVGEISDFGKYIQALRSKYEIIRY